MCVFGRFREQNEAIYGGHGIKPVQVAPTPAGTGRQEHADCSKHEEICGCAAPSGWSASQSAHRRQPSHDRVVRGHRPVRSPSGRLSARSVSVFVLLLDVHWRWTDTGVRSPLSEEERRVDGVHGVIVTTRPADKCADVRSTFGTRHITEAFMFDGVTILVVANRAA